MDVAFPVKEGKSLQDVSGTVLHQPHGVALLGSAARHQTQGHSHSFLKLLVLFATIKGQIIVAEPTALILINLFHPFLLSMVR